MKKIIILAILFFIFYLFYWFQIRPVKIRSYCDQVAWESSIIEPDQSSKTLIDTLYPHSPKPVFLKNEYDWKYVQCLHSKGLK